MNPLSTSQADAIPLSPRTSRWNRAARVAGAFALGLYLLFIIIILALRWTVLPQIDKYRGDVEHAASQALKTKVTVGALVADWDGVRPRLSLVDVHVYDKLGELALSLPHTEATLSWDSLLTWEVRLHRLEIDNADLDVKRQSNGILTVGGIDIDTRPGTSGGGVSDWLLDQRRIVIRGGALTWTDDERRAAPIHFEKASLLLSRFGVRHRFAVAITPPGELAAPLDVRGYFDRSLFVDEADSDGWSGQIYCKVNFIDLAAWRAYVDLPAELISGEGALRAWLKFSSLAERDGRVTRLPDLLGDVSLENVVTRASGSLPQLTLARVSGRVSLTQSGQKDALKLINVHVEDGAGRILDKTNLEAQRDFDAKGAQVGGTLKADSLSIDTLVALGQQLPLAADLRRQLALLQPRGVLHKLNYNWTGALDAPKHYRLATEFAGLGVNGQAPPPGDIEPSDGSPGFANMDGSATASDTGGSLALNAHDAVLDLPELFEDAQIPVAALSGHASWQISGRDLTVHIEGVTVQNKDLTGSISGTYLHGPKSGSRGPGHVDFSGQLSLTDVHQLARYMPVTLGADARSYLSRALVSGTADETTYEVRGPMERFPFRPVPGPRSAEETAQDAAERFKIDTHLHNVTFDYAPAPPGEDSTAGAKPEHAAGQWPPISNAEGELTLDRDHLTSDFKTARIENTDATKLNVEVVEVGTKKALVKLRTDLSGATQNYVRFLNDSPMAGWFGHITDKTRASGDARLHLELNLPITEIDQSVVNGKLSFGGSDLTLFEWLPQIAGVKGDLNFTRDGFGIKGMTGKMLGGDIKVDATTAADHVLEVRGQGTLSVDQLAKVPEFPFIERLAPRMSGTTSYKVALNLAAFGANDATALTHGPRVLIESSLNGVNINLPEPLHKTATSALPLSVLINPSPGQKARDEIDLHLDSVFHAIFVREADASGSMQVVHSAYGVNTAAQISDARASANVIAKSFDADAWRKVLDDLTNAATASNPAPSSDPAKRLAEPASPFTPDSVIAKVDDLKLMGKHFAKVSLNAAHSNQTWQASVVSSEVAGKIIWRDATGLGDAQQNRVTARLDRLYIPETADSEVQQLIEPSDEPAQIPALDVVADDFQLRDHKLGKLELLAANVTNGSHHEWRMDKLNISNLDATFQAKGTWDAATANQDETHMTVALDAKNVGKLFDRLDLAGTVKDGTATVTGDIAWQGTPFSIDSKTLTGNLKLDVKRGQFLKVEPGLGKLLNVLSLQSLQRRLTFDFSDLFSNGFAFDAIAANVDIKSGVATSQDFEMRGPSAIVHLDGSANLIDETQRLHVKVLPQINLGTGALAYALLANPAIGLGTLVFQELLKDPISNALSYEYNVTGSWVDPTIERGSVTSAPRAAPASKPATPPAPAPAAPAADAPAESSVITEKPL